MVQSVSSMAAAQGERLARMEVEVQELKTSFDSHKEETKARFDRIESKLDDLLALRDKGLGVFWLMSILGGTGIIAIGAEFIKWIAGK
jgi:ferritin-like metal-binding protein YciE